MDTIRDLELNRYGITVVLITHHMDEAAQAQRLVVMAGGHIIDDGPPTRCFSMLTPCEAPVWRFQKRWGCSVQLKKEGLPVPLDAIRDEDCAAVLAGLLQ